MTKAEGASHDQGSRLGLLLPCVVQGGSHVVLTGSPPMHA